MRKALAVLVLAVLFVSAIGPGKGQEGKEGETIDIVISMKQITNTTTGELYPKIYGDTIVWSDWRNDLEGNQGGDRDNLDIYSYNLITQLEQRITTNYSWEGEVDIFNNDLVWTLWNFPHSDIYYFNLTNGNSLRIIEGLVGKPKLFDKLIVYVNVTNNNGDIQIYNLSNMSHVSLTMDVANYNNPDIWRNYVVWSDFQDERGDIFLYDLHTSIKRRITPDEHGGGAPKIYGDKILYGLNYSLYLYNISTEVTEEIKFENIHAMGAEIWGNYVVWQQSWGIGGTDIILYDLSSNNSYTLTERNYGVGSPSIWENKVVFTTDINGQYDIWLFEFTFPEPSKPTFWEQNRMPIGLGITILIIALVVVFLLRGKKGKNREGIGK